MGFHSWCRPHSSGFGSAHALSSQTEDGDGRDEEDEIVELTVCQQNESINGIQIRSYRGAGVLVLLDLRPRFDEEAAQIGEIGLQVH